MSTVKERSSVALNINQEYGNVPELISECRLNQINNFYILRMRIGTSRHVIVPTYLNWVKPIIDKAVHYQTNVLGLWHPFVYLTIRSGKIDSYEDDMWHVDGFSMRYTHLPEQNYIWCNSYPTEYVDQKIKIPQDFDPLKHNLHFYLQENVKKENIKTINSNTVYLIDPYVIHRRPFIDRSINRCFVRVSFVPIEIEDDENTISRDFLSRKYNRIGRDVRRKLVRYE